MTANLQNILNLNSSKIEKLTTFIGHLRVLHPAHRYHLMSHMQDKLKDPTHQACSLVLEALCMTVVAMFTPEEISILLDEIDPTDAELKAHGILEQVNEMKRSGRIH